MIVCLETLVPTDNLSVCAYVYIESNCSHIYVVASSTALDITDDACVVQDIQKEPPGER